MIKQLATWNMNWVKFPLGPSQPLLALLITILSLLILYWRLILYWLLTGRNCICLLLVLIHSYIYHLIIRYSISSSISFCHCGKIFFLFLFLCRSEIGFFRSVRNIDITLDPTILETIFNLLPHNDKI